jgi:hypothetical protein
MHILHFEVFLFYILLYFYFTYCIFSFTIGQYLSRKKVNSFIAPIAYQY